MGVVRDVRERFWEKVDKAGPAPEHRPDLGPCWVWTAALDGSGYGQLWNEGRLVLAHRLALALMFGPIPDTLTVDHLCRRARCVNPDHLELVTLAVNRRRQAIARAAARTTGCMVTGCRTRYYARGLCHRHYSRWTAEGRPEQAVWLPTQAIRSDQRELEMVGRWQATTVMAGR